MRNYSSYEKDMETIATEVITQGDSFDWHFATEDEVKLASDLEKGLKKYNIGFIDAKKGRWSYKLNGSRHFTAFKGLRFLQGKVNSLVEMVKK